MISFKNERHNSWGHGRLWPLPSIIGGVAALLQKVFQAPPVIYLYELVETRFFLLLRLQLLQRKRLSAAEAS